MVGGVIVGLTSVGSGSLMIVLLLFLYPMISAKRLVGTDLTQAVPLTLAAALGALVFGHVEFGVTVSIILGSVPAVLIGSLLSSRAPDKYIRPVITFVIFASGLKYVGVPTTALGWTLGGILLAAAMAWVAVKLVRRRRAAVLPRWPPGPRRRRHRSRRRRRASATPQPGRTGRTWARRPQPGQLGPGEPEPVQVDVGSRLLAAAKTGSSVAGGHVGNSARRPGPYAAG